MFVCIVASRALHQLPLPLHPHPLHPRLYLLFRAFELFYIFNWIFAIVCILLQHLTLSWCSCCSAAWIFRWLNALSIRIYTYSLVATCNMQQLLLQGSLLKFYFIIRDNSLGELDTSQISIAGKQMQKIVTINGKYCWALDRVVKCFLKTFKSIFIPYSEPEKKSIKLTLVFALECYYLIVC